MPLRQTLDRWLLSRTARWAIRIAVSVGIISGVYLGTRQLSGSRRAAQASVPRLEVPHPSIERTEPHVQAHLREVREVWEKVLASPQLGAAKRARADAELGKVYLAYNFADAARASFANAEATDPGEYRWPYFHALALRDASQVEPAAQAMERAVERMLGDVSIPREHHVAALCFLGEAWSQLENAGRAEQVLKEAAKLDANCLYAAFQLGRLALDREDYQRAVVYLEPAWKLAPRNPALRQALATAYRGLGQGARAAELTADLGDLATRPRGVMGWRDPLRAEIAAMNRSSFELVRRGMDAQRQGRYAQAAQLLNAAVQVNPKNATAWTNLGASFSNQSRFREALEAYHKAEELEPNVIENQLGIGIVLIETGQSLPEAVKQFETVERRDPNNALAGIWLAATQMRQGQWDPALARLQGRLVKEPGQMLLRLGTARCLFALQRYAEARQTLEKGCELDSRSPALMENLARLLATCPDAAQRDGPRSVELAERGFSQFKTVVYGETLAMALAEAGRFDDAVKQQAWVLTQLPAGTRVDVRERVQANLKLYQEKKPCRDPWPPSDAYPQRRIADAAR